MNALTEYKNEITVLCESHRVKKLYAFGSVLTSNFNIYSDIDLIVDFKDLDIKDYADNYFDLKFSLQNILNSGIIMV